MKYIISILISIIILSSCSSDSSSSPEQTPPLTASEVISFTPGTGQDFGQDAAYYPN